VPAGALKDQVAAPASGTAGAALCDVRV